MPRRLSDQARRMRLSPIIRDPAVVIVDDDPAVRLMLRRSLGNLRCRVHDSRWLQHAICYIAHHKVDLIIWGTDEPLCDVTDVIHSIRRHSPIPILVLSARRDEDIAVDALESGADDFLRKPFGQRELLARVKNALRRRAREEGIITQVVTGDLEIDLLHRRIRSGGQEVHLPARLYDVLRLLTEHAGKPLTKTYILNAVWGSHRIDRVQYLRIAIRQLRRKLEPDPARPRYILTDVSVGYRLEIRDKEQPERSATPRPSEERA